MTSAFALISSALPPVPDVGGVPGKRLKLTRNGLKGARAYWGAEHRQERLGDFARGQPEHEAGQDHAVEMACLPPVSPVSQ